MIKLGEWNAGVESVRASIVADPADASAYLTLGNALMQQGRAGEAVPLFDMATRLKPGDADLLNSLACALRESGEPLQALACLDRALALQPELARAHNNRGSALRDLKRLDDARAAYERAVELDPRNALARDNLHRLMTAVGLSPDQPPLDILALGDSHLSAERAHEALHYYDQHLRAHPDHADALNHRGAALLALQRREDAAVTFGRLIGIEPDNASAHNNLGASLELDQPERALECFERATQLDPDNPSYWFHRAQVLMRMDRHEDAVPCLDRVLVLQPDFPLALASRVSAQRSVCDWHQLPARTQALHDALRSGRLTEQPFQTLVHCDDPQLHLQCARRHAAARLPAVPPMWVAPGPPRAHRRLRIGYLSADLHEHATSLLMAGLFECHDRERFEVFAYSFGPDRQDPMRERLLRAFDHFVDIRHLTDEAAAQLMLEHRIDIAVDLKGYTYLGRPGILAHRPAPLQVSYLGYPGTLGASGIDYIVADAQVLPTDQHRHYTEKVVTLPGCYQVNDRARIISTSRPTRRALGLPEDGMVFCCFNNSAKLGPEIFNVWMRLLHQVPGSVLWLLADFAAVERNLRREAQGRGVSPERLVFAPRLRNAEHLARLAQADLFLDTLPYNAHTTTSDALWAGVPVLTCRGQAFAGRVAASLLVAVGLPELVTDSLQDYEVLALQLAHSPGRRQALREHLERARVHSPLFDTTGFARNLEAAYRHMWQRHRDGLRPASFEIEALGAQQL